jgi:hypothetical protein
MNASLWIGFIVYLVALILIFGLTQKKLDKIDKDTIIMKEMINNILEEIKSK